MLSKLIDTNVMLGTIPHYARTATTEDLLKLMDQYGITSAVAWHSGARQDPAEFNAEMRAAATDSSGRIQYCALLDVALMEESLRGCGDLSARLRADRPVAIKLFPKREGTPFLPFFYGSLLEVLEKFRLPVLLDWEQLSAPEHLIESARTYPQLPLVIFRGSGSNIRVMLPLLKQFPNIYADMSILIDAGGLEVWARSLGSTRQLLWGSGLPYNLPPGGLGLIYYARLPVEDKEGIAFANWERLMEEVNYENC